MGKSFYVVMRDSRCCAQITKRHETIDEARNEARRLSAKENDRFYIFVAFECVQPIPHTETIALEWFISQEEGG